MYITRSPSEHDGNCFVIFCVCMYITTMCWWWLCDVVLLTICADEEVALWEHCLQTLLDVWSEALAVCSHVDPFRQSADNIVNLWPHCYCQCLRTHRHRKVKSGGLYLPSNQCPVLKCFVSGKVVSTLLRRRGSLWSSTKCPAMVKVPLSRIIHDYTP